MKYLFSTPPAELLVVVFVCLIRIGTHTHLCKWLQTDLEADRLEWSWSYSNGQIFHLFPAGAVFIVVTRALGDDEGYDDVGVHIGTQRDPFRFPVAGHDVRAGARSAEGR